jgi:transposase InsO family protein
VLLLTVVDRLAQLGMRASMGRVGSCYDDAVAESFFATLKTEIGTTIWATKAQARNAVFAYLAYYNQARRHSTIKHRTPHEARIHYRQTHALAA